MAAFIRSRSRFIRTFYLIQILMSFTCGIVCMHQIKQSDMDRSVFRAREFIENSGKVNKSDLVSILETYPKWSLYIISGDYAQYSFSWTLNDKIISVSGQGDRYSLEGAKLKITKTFAKPQ